MGLIQTLKEQIFLDHAEPITDPTPEQQAEIKAAQEAPKRYIQRHSLQTRITHGVVAISCIWLIISGLFVFIPPLGNLVGGQVVQFFRMSHRVIGVVFIAVPILSAITAPGGFKEFLHKYLAKWTDEDKEFMVKFVPYMLGPKKVHMPDQDEVKSGQRIADGALIISGIMLAISGLCLWLVNGSPMFMGVMRFIHDLFFLLIVIFGVAHAYLGGGIFQPYKNTLGIMWGDGKVAESDALYHWGFWAREEIEKGNVMTEEEIAAAKEKQKEYASTPEEATA